MSQNYLLASLNRSTAPFLPVRYFFRGIVNAAGGLIPYFAAKLPWFTANPKRPRESM